MDSTQVLIIGGGPAGLSAALAAASLGAQVVLCERDEFPGGQLVKQTHKFFGSEKQSAGERGFLIGRELVRQAEADPRITLLTDGAAVAVYEDNVAGVVHQGVFRKFQPERLIIATGAAEKFLTFPGNDLPGVYGAGAVQTLMNVDGIKPAERVLMIGSGNIGLIVSYQLLQAGVQVAGVIEALPQIGGYLVHAAKIRRLGVPIKCCHTILEAYGEEQVCGARVARIGPDFQPIPGTEEDVACDAVCLAVGLSPLAELCWQAQCEMMYVKELSGHVPLVDQDMRTSREWIYAAGDVDGIEEASSAMVEGRLAGYAAAESLGLGNGRAGKLKEEARAELDELRAGPMSAKIRLGLEKLETKGGDIHVNLDRYSH